jgi:PAS domain S-box-containing protein
MKKKRNQSPEPSALRQRAEVRLNTSKSENESTPELAVDTQRILYELEVHQIELEMQNEELRHTRAELEASQARYFDLFDLAPVGFVILNETGMILETNLAETNLLGVARNTLVNLPLTHFILPEDQDIYYHLRKRLFETQTPQACELRMLRAKVIPFWAELMLTAGQDVNGMLVFRAVMNDITERKRAEKALRESEEGYRALFENSITGISQALPDGRLIRANTAYAQMYGYANPEEMMAEVTHVGRLYANPEDREEVLRVLADKGIMEPKEMAVIRRDGTRLNVLVGARKVEDSEGKLRCYQAVHVDITERKRAEDALYESRALQKAIFDSTADMIWSVDPQCFGLLTFNHGLRDYFIEERGIHIKIGDRPEEFFQTTEFVERWHEMYRRVLREGSFTTEYIVYSGKQILELTFNILKRENTIFGISVFGKDITERKRGEIALLASEEQFHTLAESALVGFYILRDGKYTYVNPAMARVFGYSVAEMIGMTPREIVQPDDLGKVDENIRRRITGEVKTMQYEARGRHKDGSTRNVEVYGTTLEMDGRPALIGTLIDTTNRKQAEEALAQSTNQLHALTAYWQAAVEAERAYIAREMHDEFGQSMTALKMDLTWLARRLPEGDERLERIRGMNTLVDDSIGVMRRIATELRPNLLDDLGLSAALEWQAREFSRHSGIPCRVKLPKQDLNLDPALSTTLFRIFQETLTNVARHAQATRIHASLQEKNQTVILTIWDNGRGITQSELEAPRSLGLLGLRERAAQWGGKTTIRGAAGKGTSVTVSIPLPGKTTTGGDR